MKCKYEVREGDAILCLYPGMDEVDALCSGHSGCEQFEKDDRKHKKGCTCRICMEKKYGEIF